ncbi:exonuclease SbcCD subunit D [Halorussus gelatinilyticus]|uniref:DNA double-strand break repair protein Mre11 n=1 Tax=Halorussus gelatinilyticus TaxID=2937524 RepID=A0A8U0IEL5_9EURY|nr:DNA double-strand break repair protein Mre11 [Halorussus gelatinilyticus]UPV99402.1 exonuclease SbcCD subunit D [Halorussus gelatinilyticus]
MTRVIHTGDTHLGYQQYHSPERREDFLRAFEQVVTDAIEEDVDAVVHAGDLFHDRRPDLNALHGTISILRRLRDAGVPFLAVVGNHEGTRGRQWLDLFEMLGLATRLGDEPEVVGDTAFYGLDHVPKSKRDDLDYRFAPHDRPHAALVSHGLFQPFDLGDWDAEEVLTEASVDFDAMLLGDNHDPGKKRVAETWVTYCGSTERCSTDEREDRGYNIVEFDGETTIARRGLDATRDFEFVAADLAEGEGIERVRETLRERDLEDAVVVVEIDGDGEDVTPARVEEFALDAGALVARVKDRREAEDEDGELDVSFADPDDAVRDRVRDLGLSEAARDIDETVRASKVADANVRESVRNRVSELVAEGDLDAFESAPETDESETVESEGEAEGEAESEERDPSDDGETRAPDPDDPEAVEAVAEAAADAAAEGETTADSETTAEGDSPEASDADGTLEEYL